MTAHIQEKNNYKTTVKTSSMGQNTTLQAKEIKSGNILLHYG